MPGFELIEKEEKKKISKIFDNGGILFRQGFENLRNNCFKVNEFEKKFAKKLKSKYSLAVTSGTAALRVALSTLDLRPKDEIITQAFTFVATVEAIIESKATPVCCDVNDTLNMDPESLIKKINKKTKAIIVVHMLGIPADLKRIKEICDRKKITIIEDTAWGCGGLLGKKYLGTIGQIGCFSFDFAKTITTGEGGMILFKHKKDYLKAKAWHDHGHENNPKYPRWEDTRKSSGFNFRMNELQGAVGIAQLKKLFKVVKLQRKNKKKVVKIIKKFKNIKFRSIPNNSYETADSLIFFVKDKKTATSCKNELNKIGIFTKILPEATTWHFAGNWTHMKELKTKNKNLKKNFKKSYNIISKAISLPISIKMDKKFPKKIFQALSKVLVLS